MIRQRYLTTHDLIVVKTSDALHRLGLKIGDKVDRSKFKGFHVASMYNRRLLGVEGSEWAKNMIVASKNNLLHLKPEVADIKAAVLDCEVAEPEVEVAEPKSKPQPKSPKTKVPKSKVANPWEG